MHQLISTPKERLRKMIYHCASCDETLDLPPSKSPQGWYIPCRACGTGNLIIPVFKLVKPN